MHLCVAQRRFSPAERRGLGPSAAIGSGPGQPGGGEQRQRDPAPGQQPAEPAPARGDL